MRSEIEHLIILPTDQILVTKVRQIVLNKDLSSTIKENPLQSYLMGPNTNGLLYGEHNTTIYLQDIDSTSSS